MFSEDGKAEKNILKKGLDKLSKICYN